MPKTSTTTTDARTYTRQGGVAGQVSVKCTELVPEDGGWPKGATVVTAFVGSTYGGPVVYCAPGGSQSFVTDPARFGDFAADPVKWARTFHADLDCPCTADRDDANGLDFCTIHGRG